MDDAPRDLRSPERPAVCVSLRPTDTMCGANRDEAMAGLAALERATRPER